MFIPSLGQRRYFSALKYMTAVIGNSSSGIIEVPSFGIPTLDIGDRQKGRIAAESVVHCGYSTEEILGGLEKVVSLGHKTTATPYYKVGTCDAILDVIKTYPLNVLVQKQFYDIIETENCGKKLDFLMQEFNRETNTMCSKANDVTITQFALALKNEIEKIREQVQNVE